MLFVLLTTTENKCVKKTTSPSFFIELCDGCLFLGELLTEVISRFLQRGSLNESNESYLNKGVTRDRRRIS
jgi:hypothetical protein